MLRGRFTLVSILAASLLRGVASWLLWTGPRVALVLFVAAVLLLPRATFRLRSATDGQVIQVDGTQVLRYGAGDWFAPVRDEWGRGGFHHFRGTDPAGRTLGLVLVPGWLLPSAAALAVGAWAAAVARDRWRAAVTRERHRAGRCPACGYDLRATPEQGGALLDRCPECGAVR